MVVGSSTDGSLCPLQQNMAAGRTKTQAGFCRPQFQASVYKFKSKRPLSQYRRSIILALMRKPLVFLELQLLLGQAGQRGQGKNTGAESGGQNWKSHAYRR